MLLRSDVFNDRVTIVGGIHYERVRVASFAIATPAYGLEA